MSTTEQSIAATITEAVVEGRGYKLKIQLGALTGLYEVNYRMDDADLTDWVLTVLDDRLIELEFHSMDEAILKATEIVAALIRSDDAINEARADLLDALEVAS